MPVDLVVSTALAALRTPPKPGDVDYLQVSSSTSNPLTLSEVRHWVQTYFAAHPWIDKDGTEVRPDRWQFSDPAEISRWVDRRRRALHRSERVLKHLPSGWLTGPRSAVRHGLRSLETMGSFIDLYEPYTCASTTYDSTRTRALLAEQAAPGDRVDVTAIDWQRYLMQAHLPAVAALMMRRTAPVRGTQTTPPPRRAVAPARRPRALGAPGTPSARGPRSHGGTDASDAADAQVGALGA